MPNISIPYQQHRRATGSHTMQQDKYQLTQQSQDERIKKLACRPGLHSGNHNRQNTAHAMVNLLAVLSTVRNHHIGPAVTPARAEDISRENRTRQANSPQTRPEVNKVFLVPENKVNPPASINYSPPQKPLPDIPSRPPEIWNKMTYGIQQITNYITPYDILKFPMANADSVTPSVAQQNLTDLFDNITESIIDIHDDFISSGDKKISQYYEDTSSTKSRIKNLVSKHIKKTIPKFKNINIDPTTTYLLCLNGDYILVEDKLFPRRPFLDKIADQHIVKLSPAKINTSLTNWLLNSKDNPFDWEESRIDRDCGIYNISKINQKYFIKKDELNILASDVVTIFSDFDISSFAQNQLLPSLENKEAFIKRRFIDFVIGLENSMIDNNFVKDALQGIGKLPGKDVTLSPFAINSYEASNAFIFKNHKNGRITLYFPNNIVKFIGLPNDSAMERWVMHFCKTRNGREQLASHFSLLIRQDGKFYYGIDSWLIYFGQNNDYGNAIARGAPINKNRFFYEYHDRILKKINSDLHIIDLAPGVYKTGLWENLLYDLNLIPNPITPFISFAFNLVRALNADSYQEKISEYKKLRDNAINILCMSLLSEMLEAEELLGYAFINRVRVLLTDDNELLTMVNLKESEKILLKETNALSSPLSDPLTSKNINFYSFHKTRIPKFNENYFIEDEAYQYLMKNGKPSQSHPKINVGQGVFIDNNFNMIFSTGDNNFNILHIDSEGTVEIENLKKSEKSVTKLYPHNDKYLLIREKNNDEFLTTIPLTVCAEKKSPTQKSRCSQLKITSSLDQLLKKEIKNRNTSSKTILTKDMHPLPDEKYPNIYRNQKNGKYYFLHEGHFFNAEWIAAANKKNPTNKEALKLYKSPLLSGKKDKLAIVTLIEKKNDKDTEVILSLPEEYLASTVNVPRASIDNYFENEDLVSLGHANKIHTAVAAILKSGVYNIPDIELRITPKITLSPDIIRAELYPKRYSQATENIIQSISLSEINEGSFSYLYAAKWKVSSIINHIKNNVFELVMNRLEVSDKKVTDYISSTFKTDSTLFIHSFSAALAQRIEFIRENLKSDKIILSYINKTPSKTFKQLLPKEDPYGPPILNYADCLTGTIAFTPTDGSRNFVINSDKLYYMNGDHETYHYVEEGKHAPDLVNILVHEASHFGGMALDITYNPLHQGQYLEASKSISHMIDKIKNGEIKRDERLNFEKLNLNYFKSIAVYKPLMQELADNQALDYLLRNDPGYLATVMLNNADSIALLVRDIYALFTKKTSAAG